MYCANFNFFQATPCVTLKSNCGRRMFYQPEIARQIGDTSAGFVKITFPASVRAD